MNFNEVNVLGQVIDSSYGRSSSPDGTWSIKTQLAGDTMTMKYTTIVHFASERGLGDQVQRCVAEATQRIDAYLSEVKSAFKDGAGRALKTTDNGGTDDVELIQSTARSPRKVAYYRYHRNFTIE
jgi:hypothetical protein